MEVLEEAVRVQAETQQVAKVRLDAGIVPELDYAQATAQLESRRSLVPVVAIQMQQSLHRLGVLLGGMPTSLREELAAKGTIPSTPPKVPVGLPTDLLQRRPDIRRAERELASATARIGVTTADLYPKFTLTGTLGMQADAFNTWGSLTSHYWSIGPGVRWNAFDAGRIRNNIEAADARAQQSLAMYDKTILSAFEEVENRLVAFTQEQTRWNSLREAVAANQRAVDLATDLNRAGIRDFLNVLDSQRALYDTQDQLVQSEVSVTTGLIALYKSLGGGWEGQLLAPALDDARVGSPPASSSTEAPPSVHGGAAN
jgi:NodT family efflux transporter outer membrane factor (OMF) lipoprotein